MRDRVHDPLVVHSVLPADEIGVVLCLQRRVDEKSVRWFEGEFRHLVVGAHVKGRQSPRLDCGHPPLDRVAVAIKIRVVDAWTRLEEVRALFSQPRLLDEHHRVVLSTVDDDTHRWQLQLPLLDLVQHPDAVLALDILLVGTRRVVLRHPAKWMGLLFCNVGRRVLKVERVGAQLGEQPGLDRREALGILAHWRAILAILHLRGQGSSLGSSLRILFFHRHSARVLS